MKRDADIEHLPVQSVDGMISRTGTVLINNDLH